MYSIECEQVSKVFTLRGNGNCINRRCSGDAEQDRKLYALRNVSISIAAGENIGFVGLNGSGKTTLSRIIAGVMKPSTGTVKVQGTVGMLSPRTGLNGALTGRENIYYKCLLLGFTMCEIQKMENSIISFAELEEFIDQPLKRYSSGMASRLGFAICAHTEPDILIVDESLAVGDQSYMEKCMQWINDYKSKGHCVIFVSHTVSQMRGFCDRVMWLHKGDCVGIGTPDEILPSYQTFAKEYNLIKNSPNAGFPNLEAYQRRIAEKQHG